jgi:histidinol-phosphatase
MPRCNNMSLRRTKSKVRLTLQEAFSRHWCISVTNRVDLDLWPFFGLFIAGALTSDANGPQASPVENSENQPFDGVLATAHTLADRAGAVILPHFRTSFVIDHKGGDLFDPVTAADRAAETAIRNALAELHPSHGIVGEEYGALRTDAEYCWVVDPIDGTRAFIVGQPLWGTLIGLKRGGVPVLGVMDQPFVGERFFSGESESFLRHGGTTKPMRTRTCPSLSDALLTASSPDLFTTDEERERFESLARAVRLRRFGGDCYNYCLLALGQVDLVVEAGLHIYDILPLIPIIERAGGIVTTWDGGDASDGGRILAAGDKRLHEAALELLSGCVVR